jgi:ATP-dependent DNA helicase RecQ
MLRSLQRQCDNLGVHTPELPPRALQILQSVFGYAAFRGQQAEVVAHVAGGGNALVLMPTGGGKSLCYQVPALLRDGLAIVFRR